MPRTLDLILFVRQQMVTMLDGLTVEQVNEIPNGFNNNLIWNLAHMVSVEQGYLYGKGGITPPVDATLIADYGNGTFPKEFVSQDEITMIKELAISSVERLRQDVESGAFANFPPTTITPKAISLDTIHDALEFILFHEGLHLGTAKALKGAINN